MSDDGRRTCPKCHTAILRPAREGGDMVLGTALRMRTDGNADARCPNRACREPLELIRKAKGEPLIIRRLTRPKVESKGSPT